MFGGFAIASTFYSPTTSFFWTKLTVLVKSTGYLEATVDYALRRPDLKDKFLEYLNGIVGREAKNASVRLAVFVVGGGKGSVWKWGILVK